MKIKEKIQKKEIRRKKSRRICEDLSEDSKGAGALCRDRPLLKRLEAGNFVFLVSAQWKPINVVYFLQINGQPRR